MKKISFSLSDQEYDEITALAKEKNLSVTEFILISLPIKKIEKKVTLEDVFSKLPSKHGEVFSIDGLFDEEMWNAFTKGSRIAIGRAFKKIVETTGKALKVKYLRKNSANLAFYQRF